MNGWERLMAAACVSVAFTVEATRGGTVTWDDGGGDDLWSTGDNWSGTPDNTEPTAADDASFPANDTITLSAGETASNLTFGGTVTLTSGDLTLSAGGVNVAATKAATINSTLKGVNGLSKTGAGTLTLGGVNLLTGGITINAGTLTVPSTARLALGNNAINLNGGVLDTGSNLGAVYLREFGGSSYFSSKITPLYINSLNDTTYSGASGDLALGSTTAGHGNGLIKTGPGALSITGGKIQIRTDRGGLALWRGGLTVGGNASITEIGPTLFDGTLTIDDTASVMDRVGNTLTVTLLGGGNSTFRYIGNASADSAETVAALTKPASTYGVTATIDVRPGSGRNATLTFASYGVAPRDNDAYSVDAIVNFKTGAGNTFGTDAKVLFTTVPELWNGVLMSGFVNGTDFATYESATPKGIMAFGSTGSGTTYAIPTDVNTPASTDTVLINETATTLALTASKRYNALKIDGARTLDLGDYTLSIGQNSNVNNKVGLNAMIVKTGSGEAVIASTASGGLNNVDRANSRADEYQFYVNEGVLKVTARVLGATYLRVNKAGPGLLWLAPVANWPATSSALGSGIYFSEGAIRLDPDSGAFVNQPMVVNGGVMEIEGGGAYNPTFGTGNANFRWRSSGGFAAYGADAAFSPAITWNAANHIPDGAALLLSSTTADSKITLSGGLSLGTDTAKFYLREIQVADNPASAGDEAEISGQITGAYTYPLVKTGPGELILSHANNTYEGRTYVKEGKLTIAGDLANTIVEVMNTATVKVAAAVAAWQTAGLKLDAASTFELDRGAAQAGRLDVNGTVELGGATLSIGGSGSVPSIFTLIDNDGSDAVLGTFSGLAEGAIVNIEGTDYTISYVGNDGNDVVLDGQVVVVGAPEIDSSNATQVAHFSAMLNGYLVSTGTAQTTVYVAWDTNGTHTIDDPLSAWMTNRSFAPMTAEDIPLATNITGLSHNTTYYFNFFATNSVAGDWGAVIRNFTTSNAVPAINNAGGADVGFDSAVLNGTLTSTGAAPTTVWVAWDTNTARTADEPLSAWMTNHTFVVATSVPSNLSHTATGLLTGTGYVYTCFASNSFATVVASPIKTFTPGLWQWDFTMAPLGAATRNWNTSASWLGSTFPNQARAAARIVGIIDGANTITVSPGTTVGSLTLNDTDAAGSIVINGLTFDNGGSNAELTLGASLSGVTLNNLVIDSHLVVTFPSGYYFEPTSWTSAGKVGVTAYRSGGNYGRWAGTHDFGPLTLASGANWQITGVIEGDVILLSGASMQHASGNNYGANCTLTPRAGSTARCGTDTLAGFAGAGDIQFQTAGSTATLTAGLAPGDNGIGTLRFVSTTGNIDLNGTAQIEISGAATFDKVNLNGLVSMDLTDATIEVTLLGGYKPARGPTYAVFVNGTGYTGTPAMADGAWVYDGDGVIRYQGILGTVLLLQ